MKQKKRQLTAKQTDYSVCAQCKHGKVEEMPRARQVFFLSVFPWVVALILTFLVHSFFLIFIPLIGFLNLNAAKRKPLRRCQSCHQIQPH